MPQICRQMWYDLAENLVNLAAKLVRAPTGNGACTDGRMSVHRRQEVRTPARQKAQAPRPDHLTPWASRPELKVTACAVGADPAEPLKNRPFVGPGPAGGAAKPEKAMCKRYSRNCENAV